MEKDPLTHLDAKTRHSVESWLEGPYDEQTKAEIRKMLQENLEEVIDAFYTSLTFGTGGLRGVMGVGSNRMNRYTVTAATQGLANYLHDYSKPTNGHSVLIGYDSRHQSRQFAEESALVLAGNGIRVHLYQELRPSPLVSFGCRLLNCSAAIMITASHNPPQYNGYKLYWNNGAQVLPPHDQWIIREVRKVTSPKQVQRADRLSHPLIQEVGEEIDRAYLDAITTLPIHSKDNLTRGHELNIVYTSLHGTGMALVPAALSRWGFTSLDFVEPQLIPDGDFPTLRLPNPEEPSALKMGIERLNHTQADLLIATDPDADRVGIAVRHQGEVHIFTGNHIAVVCLYHICRSLQLLGKLHPKAAFIKTIATTELFEAICKSYDKPCFNVLTGFRYIAEKIQHWEKESNGYHYLFGGEESYGYLYGTLTRDKDAITASALICEAALQLKLQGKTLVDLLHEIYQQYGFFHENLLSVDFREGKAGKEHMKRGMKRLQYSPPRSVLNIPVEVLEDYRRSVKLYVQSGKNEPLTLPKSDILLFWLQDGSKLMIRPSGTEPKIKIYCGVSRKSFHNLTETRKECETLAKALSEALYQEMI
jgi:phosphomannomutase